MSKDFKQTKVELEKEIHELNWKIKL